MVIGADYALIITAFVYAADDLAADYAVLLVVVNDDVVEIDADLYARAALVRGVAREFAAAYLDDAGIPHLRFDLVDYTRLVHYVKVERLYEYPYRFPLFDLGGIVDNKLVFAVHQSDYLIMIALEHAIRNHRAHQRRGVVFGQYVNVLGAYYNVDRLVTLEALVHAFDDPVEELDLEILAHDAREYVRFAYKVGDECVCGFVVNFLRRSYLLDLAVTHDDYRIRHRQSFFLVVRNVNEGYADLFVHVHQLYLHILSHFEVQCAQRLVQEQYLRLVYQRPRYSHALLLTAGKILHAPVTVVLQIHHLKRGVDFVGYFLFGQLSELFVSYARLVREGLARRYFLHLQPESNIVKDVQMREKRVFLKNGVYRP